MDFPDLLVEHDPGDGELTQAVAEVFAVPPHTVHLVDGIGHQHGPLPSETTVLVERYRVRGEAALHLQTFLLHSDAEREVQTRRGVLAALEQLAKRLDMAIITDDEDLDPSGFLRIRPDGRVEAVVLDIDRLDEERWVSLLPSGGGQTPDGMAAPAQVASGARKP